MASDTTSKEQPSNSHDNIVNSNMAVQLLPELLMAAKRGNWRNLKDLMSKDGALVPLITFDIEEGDEHYSSDSVLHVVACSGDSEEFLRSATVICGKAKHILGAHNVMGDTALSCAARAGSIKMVSHLIDLSRQVDDGASSTAQIVLRKQNKQGETALHKAIRCANKDMVSVLMSADAELARFPRNGVSPLYLAILLGHDDIAEQMHEKDNHLSYSGPDGQNALHVAVLRSERMTKKLLEWNESLIKQGDRTSGSTPLHFAASWRSTTSRKTAKLLLDAYNPSAYQPDNRGSFPIHVAASGNHSGIVYDLLEKCPDCAQLRDAQGRTLLHTAAFEDNWFLVWRISRLQRTFASVMDMQDNEGNTALHLAAKAGKYWAMCPLIWNQEVELNLQNNEGQTALDLSRTMTAPGVKIAPGGFTGMVR